MPKSVFDRCARWIAFLAGMATCGQLFGCSDQSRNLSLIDAPEERDVLSEEEERVRKLQLIRAFSSIEEKVLEVTPGHLITRIQNSVCGVELNCAAGDCDSFLCSTARMDLCIAKTLLALAVPQPTPLQIAEFTVPTQSSATNAAIAAQARSSALQSISDGTDGSLQALREMMGLSPPSDCSPSDADQPHDDNVVIPGRIQSARATVAASLLVEAYETYKEATDVMVRSLLETSDAELSSSLSLTQATGRAFAGGLSRSAAAHAVVAGDPGLLGDRTRGFCTSPDLSPEAKAALQVFRDSALSPAVVLDEAIPTATVLNATGLPEMDVCNPNPSPPSEPCIPDGSVRQRWAELYGFDDLLTVPSLQDHFDLTLGAFDEARRYLREEITAFSRSITAELPPRNLAGGGTTTFKRFAATAGPPKPLPPAFYGAIARFAEEFFAADDPPLIGGAAVEAYAEVLDAVSSRVAVLLENQGSLPASIRAEAMAPLALLASAEERIGRVHIAASPIASTYTVEVHGFSPDAGLRVAIGNDELRCAVSGDVEGAACELPSERELDLSSTPFTGFTTVARRTIDLDGQPTLTPVYVLRPRVALTTPAPGQFEALTGVIIDRGNVGTLDVAIVPSAERRVAELIQPSRAWCTHPEVSCSGVTFDERLPLEDELISDGDAVESSWRHFLARAKEAAAEADALGVDYVNTGLQESQRGEEIELRREEQLQRADAEIQNLQAICGTSMDPRKLLTLLTGDPESRNIIHATGGSCSSDADCNTANPGRGFKCLSGQCVVDLSKLADAHATDPDIRRLSDCLSENTLVPFVSLGAKPLCLWHNATNAREVCAGATPGSCPRVQPGGFLHCDAVLPDHPAGTVTQQTEALGYFETDIQGGGGSTTVPDRCELLRQARAGEVSWANVRAQVTSGNFFNPALLEPRAGRLNWEARYGGYSAIVVDGVPEWETGSAWSDAGASGWPCDPPMGTCTQGHGFFCSQGANCSDPESRTVLNYTLLKAVLAARLIVMRELTETSIASVPWPNAAAFSTDAPRGVRFFFPGNVPILQISGDRTEYDASGLFAPASIGWYDFTQYFDLNGRIGDPVFEGFQGGAFGPAQFGFGFTLDPSPRSYFLSAMSSFILGYGWLLNVLEGLDDPNSLVVPVSYPFAVHILGRVSTVFGPAIGGKAEVTGNDVLNGLELLCALDAEQTVTLGSVPKVKSVSDLRAVSQYIVGLSRELQNRASLAVFADVPETALDGLREQSAVGAFPRFGGQMGEHLASLRGALLRVRETAPILANEVQQMGLDLESLHTQLAQVKIAQDISQLQLSANIAQQISNCAASFSSIGPTNPLGGFGAAVTCANSVAQINFASGIAELTQRSTELDGDRAIAAFGGRFSDRATNIQVQSLRLAEAQEDIDASLARIESLRLAAKSSVARALYLSSFQAEHEVEVTSVIGNLFAAKQIRYQQALQNAKLLAFLAKRAIEQRLGVRLSAVTEDFPLVEAPATWEASVCTFAGIDYNALKATEPEAAQNFAGGFIGDYVKRLENFIESYRLRHNFHEGTDTAVVSLRDDVLNVRAPCEVPVSNLLFHTDDLRQFGEPGWIREGCPTEIVEDVEQPEANCVTVLELGEALGLTSSDLANTQGFELEFGEASTAQSAIVQSVDLRAGTYRFTWYTKEGIESGAFVGGSSAATLRGDDITITDGTDVTDIVPAPETGGWNRRFLAFRVPTNQNVRIGFGLPASGTTVTVAAPMLEALPNLPESFALAPFVSTGETLTRMLPACEDTTGDLFRATSWRRDCVKLCADGYASNCAGARAETHCFREAEFGVSQRAIQLGKIFNTSGFARGNFNYRIESVGVNFVGSGIRACAVSDLPSTCHAAGYVPYSLYHNGPFYVRNHQGDDFRAYLFDGAVEHARGLGIERYITNPLSSADRELVTPYFRTEFQGRPLDGNFVIRVWEEPGLNFEAIQDVQVVLNYRYWTRFH
jgi:hypothetical protein